jgi:hypothetical protein
MPARGGRAPPLSASERWVGRVLKGLDGSGGLLSLKGEEPDRTHLRQRQPNCGAQNTPKSYGWDRSQPAMFYYGSWARWAQAGGTPPPAPPSGQRGWCRTRSPCSSTRIAGQMFRSALARVCIPARTAGPVSSSRGRAPGCRAVCCTQSGNSEEENRPITPSEMQGPSPPLMFLICS